MNHQRRLKGARVSLRPTKSGDLAFLQKLWNDGEVMGYVGYPEGLGIDEQGMCNWFEGLGAHRHRDQDREHWIVQVEGKPIGEAYFRALEEFSGYKASGMAELDLKLAKKFWGRGYASDALRTLARYLFERGFVVLAVDPNLKNKAALRLYERLGFEPKHRFWCEETKAMHQVWALPRERFEMLRE